MPEYGIEDSKCQLCKVETGTLQHRAECVKTMPPGGWPKPPKEALRLLDRISALWLSRRWHSCADLTLNWLVCCCDQE